MISEGLRNAVEEARNMKKAILALADGLVFEGHSFGAEGETSGEVVFNTSMTGYQEILTDPSYKGQIVTMTYTQIGNYGVNDEDVESARPYVEGFIVKEYLDFPSNWRAKKSLQRVSQGERHRRHPGDRYPGADPPPPRFRRAAGRHHDKGPEAREPRCQGKGASENERP